MEEAYKVVSAIEEGDDENLREELGDLLFTVVNLGRLMNIDPTLVPNGTNQKFIARFHELEKRLEDSGSSVEAATLDTMDTLWNRIKSEDNKINYSASRSGYSTILIGKTKHLLL